MLCVMFAEAVGARVFKFLYILVVEHVTLLTLGFPKYSSLESVTRSSVSCGLLLLY